MEEKTMKQAQTVYETACKALDDMQWKYTRHDEDLTLVSGARGEDLPMDIVIVVNPKSQVVCAYSPLPYKISEEKRVDGALAICMANFGMINGSFDYEISTGEIRFRITTSYRESILSEELIKYMVVITASTVDEYNDKFLMISKGMMSLQDFAKWEGRDRSKD